MASMTYGQALAQAKEAIVPTEISQCRACGQWHVWYDDTGGRTGHSGNVDFCRCNDDPAAPWFSAEGER